MSPAVEHREYRLILIGQAINNLGSELTRIALPYQLFILTHSTITLGALASMQLAASLLFSLFGGSIADAGDRRRILLCTQSGLCVVSTALAALSATRAVAPWHLYVLAFLATTFSAVDRPTRDSMLPRLVAPERLRAAITLNQVVLNASRVIGPGLGGLVIAGFGASAAFGLDAVSFTAALAALLAISAIPPLSATARPGIRAMVEGLRYTIRTPLVLAIFAIDLNATILGAPVALFPVLALDVFHAGPQGFGLMAAAPAVGGVLGLVSSGWVHHIHHQGRIVLGAVAVWGLAFTFFGLAPFFPLALFCLVVAGGADAISAMVRRTMLQLSTPDALRGRVSALNSMVVFGGPRLGDVESTAVATVTSATFSVVSGGLACLLGVGLVARWMPQLAAYDARSADRTPVPIR